MLSTSQVKEELLAKQIASNSSVDAPVDQPMPFVTAVRRNMPNIIFKVTQVDGIPPCIKKCAPKLAPILTRFFQTPYDKVIFPSGWKNA